MTRVVPAAMTKARRRSSRLRLRGRRLGPSRLLPHHPALDPGQRVVELGHDPLLERDDRVVGDVDFLRTDLGAALRDFAETAAGLRPHALDAAVVSLRVY